MSQLFTETMQEIRELIVYRDERRPPSAFVRAVLANDLMAANDHATVRNMALLPIVLQWLCANMPCTWFGSEEAVEDHLGEGLDFTDCAQAEPAMVLT